MFNFIKAILKTIKSPPTKHKINCLFINLVSDKFFTFFERNYFYYLFRRTSAQKTPWHWSFYYLYVYRYLLIHWLLFPIEIPSYSVHMDPLIPLPIKKERTFHAASLTKYVQNICRPEFYFVSHSHPNPIVPAVRIPSTILNISIPTWKKGKTNFSQ